MLYQFSAPRTGSTLIFNILKEILKNENVLKKHTLDFNYKDHKVVTTYRNPYDTVCSSILRYNLNINDSTINQAIDELKKYNYNELKNIKKLNNVLCLEYEKFYYDKYYIFNELESFLNIKINNKEELEKKYSIENVKRTIKNLNLKKFEDFDKTTHIHGNHISKFDGEPYSYLEILTKKQINKINNDLFEL